MAVTMVIWSPPSFPNVSKRSVCMHACQARRMAYVKNTLSLFISPLCKLLCFATYITKEMFLGDRGDNRDLSSKAVEACSLSLSVDRCHSLLFPESVVVSLPSRLLALKQIHPSHHRVCPCPTSVMHRAHHVMLVRYATIQVLTVITRSDSAIVTMAMAQAGSTMSSVAFCKIRHRCIRLVGVTCTST